MLSALSTIILCVALYCIKGGQHGPARRWGARKLGIAYDDNNQPLDPAWFTFAQKVYISLTDGKPLSALGFGVLALACAAPGSDPWIVFFCAALGWLAAVAPSVGEEIGAVGGFKGGWGPYLHAVLEKNGGTYTEYRQAFGRGYGFKKALQRGAWAGTCIFIGLMPGGQAPAFLIAGFLFPATAWIGISIQQMIKGKAVVSWHIHEILFGLVLGLAMATY